jgi:HK97 gp10 family phage protein
MEASTIRIEGIDKLRRALVKLDDAAKDDFKAAGKAAAEIVERQARSEVPVRSGNLKNTIRSSGQQRGGVVSAGRAKVPYAGPIHFGWGRRRIHPNPFLYRAADKRVDEVTEAYLAQVYEIWNRNLG